MVRFAVEPAEDLHLRQHAAGRAIEVGVGDAALGEGFAEVFRHADRLLRRGVGARDGGVDLLFGHTGRQHFGEVGLFLGRHVGAGRFLAEGEVGAGAEARLFHVHALNDEFGAMGRAPVGGDEAAEARLLAQHAVLRGGVAAGVQAIDLVIRAHDGRDARLGDVAERRQVDLAQRLTVHVDVAGAVVADEVLGLGHDVLRLRAAHEARAQRAGQDGVFAVGVVGALEGRVAVDVDERLQDHVNAQGARVAADQRAGCLRIRGAEGGRHRQGGGHAGRGVAHQHAGRAVGKAQVRDAKARHAGGPAGLAEGGVGRLLGAADDGHLVGARHLRQQVLDARTGGGGGLLGRVESGGQQQAGENGEFR